MLHKAIRLFIVLIFASIGLTISYYLERRGILKVPDLWQLKYGIFGVSIILGALLGMILAPGIIKLIVQTTSWLEQRLLKNPIQDIIGGAIGVIIGLIIANLLGSALSGIRWVGVILPIILSLLFGYLGLSVGTNKKEELFSLFSILPRFGREKQKSEAKPKPLYKILDTSVIIDGRIADICKSGFIEGVLIIPNFVLEELRHIADSSDLLKRNRGRRGLDILNKIRKELDIMVQISDKDFEEIAEVDSKLVKLAQVLNGKIFTNDYNLNKVAELQGVQVLNINELANAVKPVVLPGEEMVVQVIKDGKEMGQGIAYLDDGTMIVVDGGKKHMGQTIEVLVTSVLQTAAGRMIFAKPKLAHDKRAAHASFSNEVNAIG